MIESIDDIDVFDINLWRNYDIVEDNLIKYLEFIRNINYTYDTIPHCRHHIIPISIDKRYISCSSNIIRLTDKDHFIAHRMLVSCFNGIMRRSMSCAYKLMAENSTNNKRSAYDVTPEEYEEARILFSESTSGEFAMVPRLKGKDHPMYGKHHSTETKNKISKSNTGKKRSKKFCEEQSKRNIGNNYGHKNKGVPKSEKAKSNMRKNRPDYTGKNNPMYGKSATKGSKWVNKNGVNKRAKTIDEFNYYINDGWKEGCYNKEGINRDTLSGKVVVTNNFKKKYINKEEIEKYLEKGYFMWKDRSNLDEYYFNLAINYAIENTTCFKLAVGSVFVCNDGRVFKSCNSNNNYNCKEHGSCFKATLTGTFESTEETRKFCKSIHSEINMLNILKDNDIDPSKGILYITRYPCRNCLKKCIDAGVKHIKFCGKSAGSDDIPTQNPIDCKNAGVTYEWYPQFDYEY